MNEEVRTFAETPDVVIVLDIDPALAISRITNRDGKPNEFEKIEDLQKVREIFKQLCATDKELVEVDGSCSVDLIHSTIIKLLVEGTLKDKRCAKTYGCDDPYFCSFRETGTCPWWTLRENLLFGKE